MIGRRVWAAAAVMLVVVAVLAAGVAAPSAPSGPARTGCVACHTERAMLEPLVKPFPDLPAEGEG